MTTGFELVLAQVPLEPNARVLDVGAGGFAGETTTKYLVDRFNFVVGIDSDEVRLKILQEKFPLHKVAALNVSLEDFLPLHPYDLMVIDLNEKQIPWIFETAIPKYGRKIVALGGYIITLSDKSNLQFPTGFTRVTYIDKWDGCHLGWSLLKRII